MKKAILYIALAALTQVAISTTASSQSAHSGVPSVGLSARTPSHGIRPMFPRHHHHKRFHRFDFGYAAPYPGWLYWPDWDQAAGAPYAPETEYAYPPEDSAPAVPTRCVPENYSVPSQREGGQAKVTVTRCNVPILIPRSAPTASSPN
jgi:hypothetical protein